MHFRNAIHSIAVAALIAGVGCGKSVSPVATAPETKPEAAPKPPGSGTAKPPGSGKAKPSGDPSPLSALQKRSKNNLIQIAMASANYHDSRMKYPNNILSKDGKPLLSWRVAILPNIDQALLYNEFKLDEPWDSANNIKLVAKMPSTYAPVRAKAKPGETFYRGFDGPGALFETGKSNSIIAPDGTANTFAVVEAAEPVIWTKPEELKFDPKGPLPKLGGEYDGDFLAAFMDTDVYLFKKDVDPKVILGAITLDGGEPVDPRAAGTAVKDSR